MMPRHPSVPKIILLIFGFLQVGWLI